MTTAAPDLAQRITLRPKELAAALGVSYAEVKKHLRSGALPSKRLGSMRLIRIEDAKAFIDRLSP